LAVRDVDRLVEVADSKLEDVTKLDELELFSGDFNMEESEEEGVEVVVPDCVVIVDEVFGTVVMVFELEDDVRTEVYDEIEDVEIDFDEDREDNRRGLDNKGPEGEEVRVDVDGDEKELDGLDDESVEGEEVRIDVDGGEKELVFEYKFNLRGAPQSSNGFPAHLIIRLAPYFAQMIIFQI
jgi:hypothetical protein